MLTMGSWQCDGPLDSLLNWFSVSQKKERIGNETHQHHILPSLNRKSKKNGKWTKPRHESFIDISGYKLQEQHTRRLTVCRIAIDVKHCSNKFFRLQFTNSYDKWHWIPRLHMPHVWDELKCTELSQNKKYNTNQKKARCISFLQRPESEFLKHLF